LSPLNQSERWDSLSQSALIWFDWEPVLPVVWEQCVSISSGSGSSSCNFLQYCYLMHFFYTQEQVHIYILHLRFGLTSWVWLNWRDWENIWVSFFLLPFKTALHQLHSFLYTFLILFLFFSLCPFFFHDVNTIKLLSLYSW